MVLKIIGALLLSLSGLLGGWLCSSKLFARRNFLRSIINFVSVLATQIRYSTADIFTLVSLSAQTSKLKEFELTEKSGVPFFLVWSSRVNEIPSRYGLTPTDKKLFNELGEQLGKTDVEGQLKHLELYEVLLKKQLSDSENEIKSKSKLYKTMGFFVGTAAALMMI